MARLRLEVLYREDELTGDGHSKVVLNGASKGDRLLSGTGDDGFPVSVDIRDYFYGGGIWGGEKRGGSATFAG